MVKRGWEGLDGRPCPVPLEGLDGRPCPVPLKDTAGDLSPSAPSPLRGEGWGEAALWIRQQYPKA